MTRCYWCGSKKEPVPTDPSKAVFRHMDEYSQTLKLAVGPYMCPDCKGVGLRRDWECDAEEAANREGK